MLAKIAVFAARFSMDKPFSYCFGQEMKLRPGMRVIVPFGAGNRQTEGIVLSVEPGEDPALKWVSRCLDEEPVLDEAMLHLAAFIRERYFCTFYEAIRAMLPGGLWFRTVEHFTLAPDAPWRGKMPKTAHRPGNLPIPDRSGRNGRGRGHPGGLSRGGGAHRRPSISPAEKMAHNGIGLPAQNRR